MGVVKRPHSLVTVSFGVQPTYSVRGGVVQMARHGGLKSRCPQGYRGSNPLAPTICPFLP
jgi:hypothetical protein